MKSSKLEDRVIGQAIQQNQNVEAKMTTAPQANSQTMLRGSELNAHPSPDVEAVEVHLQSGTDSGTTHVKAHPGVEHQMSPIPSKNRAAPGRVCIIVPKTDQNFDRKTYGVELQWILKAIHVQSYLRTNFGDYDVSQDDTAVLDDDDDFFRDPKVDAATNAANAMFELQYVVCMCSAVVLCIGEHDNYPPNFFSPFLQILRRRLEFARQARLDPPFRVILVVSNRTVLAEGPLLHALQEFELVSESEQANPPAGGSMVLVNRDQLSRRQDINVADQQIDLRAQVIILQHICRVAFTAITSPTAPLLDKIISHVNKAYRGQHTLELIKEEVGKLRNELQQSHQSLLLAIQSQGDHIAKTIESLQRDLPRYFIVLPKQLLKKTLQGSHRASSTAALVDAFTAAVSLTEQFAVIFFCDAATRVNDPKLQLNRGCQEQGVLPRNILYIKVSDCPRPDDLEHV